MAKKYEKGEKRRGAPKEAKLGSFMVVQTFDSLHFTSWDKQGQDAVAQRDIAKICDYIRVLLKDAHPDVEISSLYGVVHDSDYFYDITGSKIAKSHHFHVLVSFSKSGGLTISQIFNALKIKNESFIERPKRGRYAFDNMLAYLTHIKYANLPEKHENKKTFYEPSLVHTGVGRPYMEIYNERHNEWARGGAAIIKKQASLDLDMLLDKVYSGELTKRHCLDRRGLVYPVYCRNMRLFEDGFKVYAAAKMQEALDSLKNGDFTLSVYFITGVAGTGKTVFANKMIRGIKDAVKDRDGVEWSDYSTAASNSMDDYMGEEIVLMDDVRGNTMSSSDWLKLLDPHNASHMSARYNNKIVANKVLIITSVIPPHDFFGNVGKGNEPLDQFIRRLSAMVEVVDLDNAKLRMIEYNDKESSYGFYHNDSQRVITHQMHYSIADGKAVATIDAIKYVVDEVLLKNKVVSY